MRTDVAVLRCLPASIVFRYVTLWMAMPGVAARAASYACGHVDNARALSTCPQAHHQRKPKDLLLLIVVTAPASEPSRHYFCCRWAECLFTHRVSIHLDDTLPSRGRSVPGHARHGTKTRWTDHELPKAGTLTRCCVTGCVTLPVRRRPCPCCRACCRWQYAASDGSRRSVDGSFRRSSPG